MSTTIKNVMIAGGNLGPTIVNALEKARQFQISILSRGTSKATFPSHIKVHKVDESYPEADLIAAFEGQDAIVSTIGLTALKQQTKLIDAAVKAGVKRFLPAEFGSSTTPAVCEAVPILIPDKLDIVNYLKTKEASGLTWTALCTGPFFDWCLRVGFLGFNFSTRTATIYDSGTTKWSGTNLSSVGTAVVSILLHPSQTANRYLYTATNTISQLDILASLEKATGGKKWTVEHASTSELKRLGKEKIERGEVMEGVGMCIVAAIHTSGVMGNILEDVELSNELLGVEEEDLDETIARVVKEVSASKD